MCFTHVTSSQSSKVITSTIKSRKSVIAILKMRKRFFPLCPLVQLFCILLRLDLPFTYFSWSMFHSGSTENKLAHYVQWKESEKKERRKTTILLLSFMNKRRGEQNSWDKEEQQFCPGMVLNCSVPTLISDDNVETSERFLMMVLTSWCVVYQWHFANNTWFVVGLFLLLLL